MLTKKEALELVSRELQSRSSPQELWVVIDKQTIERSFGWVFFYESKAFLETGLFRDRLFGNGPVIVNKASGAVEFYGSGDLPEDIIKVYEIKLTKAEK